MSRPFVAITSIPRWIPTTLPVEMPSATSHRRFAELVAEAGATGVVVDSSCSVDDLLDRVDGILLTGGNDVDPARYGEQRHELTDAPEEDRDDFEFRLAREAIERRVPILGVCRGMQLLNVLLGGTLVQSLSAVTELNHDVKDRPGEFIHSVEVAPDSLLERAVGGRDFQVNSVHHQGVGALGSGLRCTGRAPDGTVETIEHEEHRLLAVQWHPEFMPPQRSRANLGIVRTFTAWCATAPA